VPAQAPGPINSAGLGLAAGVSRGPAGRGNVDLVLDVKAGDVHEKVGVHLALPGVA
jgi:hypothetical protein